MPGPPGADRARPATRAGLQLLQRIRDEAHRFALGFHRQRRESRAQRVDPRRAPRRRAGAQARAHPALRLAGADPRREPGGARGRSRRTGEDGQADLRRAPQGREGLGPAKAAAGQGRLRRLVVALLEGAAKAGAEAAFVSGSLRATSDSSGSAPPRALRRPDPNPLSCSCTSDCSWRLLASASLERSPWRRRISPRRSPVRSCSLERGLELLVREQASLDQELAERTPVRVVVGFVERLVHEDPLPRLSARIGRRGIPRRG